MTNVTPLRRPSRGRRVRPAAEVLRREFDFLEALIDTANYLPTEMLEREAEQCEAALRGYPAAASTVGPDHAVTLLWLGGQHAITAMVYRAAIEERLRIGGEAR